jgi:putative ABC transport system permease protein
MRLEDIAFISANSLTERKFRFTLNLIGILIGCAAVTGLISLTQGMNTEITGDLGALGGNTVTVIPGDVGSPRARMPNQPTVNLDWRDLQLIEEISDVELVAPTVTGGSAIYSIKGDFYMASVRGVTEAFFTVNEGTKVEQGREIRRSDSAVAVIGYSISVPDPDQEPVIEVGDRIKLTTEVGREEKQLTVRVIGILEETGSSMGTDTTLSIPIKTYEQFFENDGYYSTIQVLVEETELVESVAYYIEQEIDGVSAITSASAMEMISSITGTIEAVLGGVAAISLLVAGVGIINTMTVSVMERTKEIGTMKAIGAKSTDILFMFMAEAALTGIIGGIIGAAFGFVLGDIIGKYVGITSTPTVSLALMVVGFAVFTSVASGLYPAWNASKLNPVEALRHE